MLRYILVDFDDDFLINKIFEILDCCGNQMYEDFGLNHWLPSYSLNAIRNDCFNKFVFIVFDDEKKRYVATFQMYIKENNSLYIRKVATHPDYYGKGVGGKNLDFIESFAKKLGLSSICLDVYNKSVQAIRFYLSKGFWVTGKKTTRRFEVLLMKKEI